MIQIRSIFFEDVPHVRDIDKERREDELFRAKQRKFVLIFAIKINLKKGF